MIFKILLCFCLASLYLVSDVLSYDETRPILNEEDQGKTYSTFQKSLRTKCDMLVDLLECLRRKISVKRFYYPCDRTKYITCSPGNVFHIMPCAPGTVFNPFNAQCGK